MSAELQQQLKTLKDAKDHIKSGHQPILTKDKKLGDAFNALDKAIEDRVKEIGGT